MKWSLLASDFIVPSINLSLYRERYYWEGFTNFDLCEGRKQCSLATDRFKFVNHLLKYLSLSELYSNTTNFSEGRKWEQSETLA